jgi:allantoinase
MTRFAIYSNCVITPSGIIKAYVLISDGKIERVMNEMPEGEMVIIDLADKVLMAGVVDPHVHINEPGRAEWEGFDTATKAAVAGGVTTLVDMPLNSSPVTTTVKALDEKIRAAKGKLHCNCGFWGGIIPGNEKEIKPLIERGVLGFKAFLTHSGIDEFPNVTETHLRKAMPIIATHGLPLLVHSELAASDTFSRPGDVRSYASYLSSRPSKWEEDAIALMIRLCEEFQCAVHIVHLSSANSLEQIVQAKQKGLPLTVETGQHYLYFNAENIKDGQTNLKCAPPIREKENNDRLWRALKEGVIDFVATDHSPCIPALKEPETGNFMTAWGGISSIQFALPVLWTAAKERGYHFTEIAEWLAEKPAALPHLSFKGKIKVGYNADLVAWDPGKKFVISEEMILHRHKITPYLGEELYGVVEQTWIGGEKVFDRGEFFLNKGQVILQHRTA